MTEFTVEKRLIEAKIRGQSIIAPVGKPPYDWGNYFNMTEGNVINMWAENLTHLVETGILHDGMVECNVYQTDKANYILITDPRVPLDYFNHADIISGSWRVNKIISEHVMDYLNFVQKDVD